MDTSRKPVRPTSPSRTSARELTQPPPSCPACGHRLSIDEAGEGAHPFVLSCRHCEGAVRLTAESAATANADTPRGLSVTYAVCGDWDVAPIVEYLFDNIGVVDSSQEGFVCYPDDRQIDCPTIMVDARSRRIRFGLFGHYDLGDATAIIHDAAEEFAARFQLDLRPAVLARWQYQERVGGFALVEHRRMGSWSRESMRRPAHA